MDSLLCICNLVFRNLVAEHKLGTGEDLSGRVDHILADPRYSSQRDQDTDQQDYGVFHSRDIKVTSKVLRDEIKLRAHTYELNFALQFVFCCMYSALEKTEVQASITEDSVQSDTERKENESVELQLSI